MDKKVSKLSTIEEIPKDVESKVIEGCNRFNTHLKLLPLEYYRYKNFTEKHKHKDVNKGAIGGHLSLTFTPTSLGYGVSVKCGICGEIENITDYNCW